LSLAPASPALDLEAVQASLKEQPDGVLDDIARRNGVPLRVVFDLLPVGAARSAPGERFVEIWGDLVDWGPVTLIVHTEDGGLRDEGAAAAGERSARLFQYSRREPAWRALAHCPMRGDLLCRPSLLRPPVLLAAVHQFRWRRHVQGLCRARREARAAGRPARSIRAFAKRRDRRGPPTLAEDAIVSPAWDGLPRRALSSNESDIDCDSNSNRTNYRLYADGRWITLGIPGQLVSCHC
jgi:hypothetical protein